MPSRLKACFCVGVEAPSPTGRGWPDVSSRWTLVRVDQCGIRDWKFIVRVPYCVVFVVTFGRVAADRSAGATTRSRMTPSGFSSANSSGARKKCAHHAEGGG